MCENILKFRINPNFFVKSVMSEWNKLNSNIYSSDNNSAFKTKL